MRPKTWNQESRKKIGLAQRLLAIGRDCAQYLQEPFRSADHGDLLYDERGLPIDRHTSINHGGDEPWLQRR